MITMIIIFTGCQPQTNVPPPDFSNAPPAGPVPNTNRSGDGTLSPNTVMTLTIPEGWTLPRIGMELESMGVMTVHEFIDATQNGDFSDFPLVAKQIPNPNRAFVLEGYLFPDTYQFFFGDPPEAIIRRMLENLEVRITPALRSAVEESGYTFDEILALASIIEREAFGYPTMGDVSSVLHNRLNIGMQLQCDATIVYVEHAIKPFIDGDINRFNDYYNTYTAPGIPPGAIGNPGLDAIRAALFPNETGYLFFITAPDGTFHFTPYWEEHVRNVNTYLRD